jgi:hypothetical protein
MVEVNRTAWIASVAVLTLGFRKYIYHGGNFVFIYRRSSNDLIMRMNIELVEALCGFQRVIKTLDDRDLVITAIPGEFCF